MYFPTTAMHLAADDMRHLGADNMRHLGADDMRHLGADDMRHLGADNMRHMEQGEGIERAIVLDRQAGGSRWLRRPGCWLLCQAGRLLVALGERLTRAGMAQALPLERAVGSR